MTKHIGFIGIGNMGNPIASRFLDAGYSLTVYDAEPKAAAELLKRGARGASSPAEVGESVDIVFICLPTPAIVTSVVVGADGLVSAKRVKTVIDLSTTGSQAAKSIAERMTLAGKTWIDSPVSGGIRGAKLGTLAVMVSGPRDEYDKLQTILSIVGKPFYIGSEAGAAQTMKLVNNLLSGAALAISAEAMVLGVKAGLNPEIMLDVINAGSGRNTATQDKFPKAVLTRSFDFGFSNGLMCKDIDLCMKEATALGLSLPTADAVQTLWQKTLREMGPQLDFTTIVKVVERAAEIEVRKNAD